MEMCTLNVKCNGWVYVLCVYCQHACKLTWDKTWKANPAVKSKRICSYFSKWLYWQPYGKSWHVVDFVLKYQIVYPFISNSVGRGPLKLHVNVTLYLHFLRQTMFLFVETFLCVYAIWVWWDDDDGTVAHVYKKLQIEWVVR